MARHLSDYYRYCTLSKSIATIGEEISYARSYLSVMAIRRRIEYSIHMPEEFEKIPVIPLILQPVIENAIEHAIEMRENARHLSIKVCQWTGGAVRFEISDDGDGLSEEDVSALKERLGRKNREENDRVGLWNVN